MSFYYTDKIYNTKAASQVVPIIIDLFRPKSVLDIGCGLGTWLKVFETYEVVDYLGIDGSYSENNMLLIESAKYIETDLEKPININRKFDLIICLEVAEHLSEERSVNFIREMTNLSQTVIFSAAIPFQGGENHINEKYPQYWIDLFKLNNFDCYDIIRPLIWNNQLVDWWYRQNILVFQNENFPSNFTTSLNVFPLISYDLYNNKLSQIQSLEAELCRIKNAENGVRFYLYNLVKVIYKRFIKSMQK
jgi:SAM-dependent methyltransferase